MTRNHRRQFLKLAGATGLTAAGLSACTLGQPKARVVVIGGGFGGATAARYVRMADPAIEVTLLERDAQYFTCPFSNLVLGGMKTMADITQGHDKLAKQSGIKVVRDEAVAVDPAKKEVRLKGGASLPYDKLIVSPGIDLNFAAVPGYDEAAAELAPHAWKAGPQTVLLRRQLEAMADGGTVVIAPPANPFRCPPGPYERASMIAHYLKQAKPRSKIVIVDPKPAFSKQALFQDAWQTLYPGMISWEGLPQGTGFTRVDAAAKTVFTGMGQWKGDVLNFIPPQRAGAIAAGAGLTNQTGWCPIDPATMESTQVKNIHVIGDATIAGAMPKSGSAANAQGKVAAAAVVAMLNGRTPAGASYLNICYSLVGSNYGISVTGVYRPGATGIAEVPNSGGVSPRQADAAFRRQEALYTQGWYDSITQDAWG
ncbi:MAG: hypothetical protein FJX46_00200 [Alphaproteobacteria bacterium]|nr:hypothetical protein [Alphaproteobacteria bacterium]